VIDDMTAATPAGVVVQPQDIANGVLYLASDESSMAHGIPLYVDERTPRTRWVEAGHDAGDVREVLLTLVGKQDALILVTLCAVLRSVLRWQCGSSTPVARRQRCWRPRSRP
jgi:hypothetical protein